MSRHAYLWPIERVDSEGEPAAEGAFLKLGMRQGKSTSAIWLDVMDAEAIAREILAVIEGAKTPLSPLTGSCDVCFTVIAPDAPAYQVTPGGGRCLICSDCAPTVQAEVSDVLNTLNKTHGLTGFETRAHARAWCAAVRTAYDATAKRLMPYRPAADADFSIVFPEPPATAILTATTESPPDDQ